MPPNADLTKKPGRLEKGFVFFAMLFYFDAFITLFELKAGVEVVPGDKDPFVFFISYGVHMGTAILILKLKLYNPVIALLKREKFLACLIGVILLSIFWSDFPLISLRRSMSFIGTTVFGIYLAIRYSLEEQLKLFALMLGFVIIASLLFGLFLPSYGISGGPSDVIQVEKNPKKAIALKEDTAHEGAWRGVFGHKNSLGRIMSLSAIIFALLKADGRKRRLIKWIFLGLSLGLLVLSTSKTSVVLLAIIFILFPLYKSLQWNFYLRVFIGCTLIAGIVGAGIMFLDDPNFILKAIGRDSTLTGRTDLWLVVIRMIEKRPLLGYGYNAFWHGWEGASGYVWRTVGWNAPHAHNGFLDLWLDLGFVGLMIFMASMVQATRNAIKMAGSTISWEAVWPLAYLTFIILYNLVESTLVKQNNLFYITYVMIIMTFYFNSPKKEPQGNM